jgi:hypothetical protein
MSDCATAARVALASWRKHQKKDKAIHEIDFGETDTPARLGRTVSQTTYPIILDDVGDLSIKERSDIIEILKSCAKTDTARGFYQNRTHYVKTLALSSIILTSNDPAPRFDGYQRASICVHFDENEKHTEEQKNEFKAWIEDGLDKLGVFGDFCVRYLIIEKPDLLLGDTDNEIIQKELVAKFYRYAGKAPPEWLDMKVESTKAKPIDDTGSTMLELRSFLNQQLNDETNRHWRNYSGAVSDSYDRPILSEKDLLVKAKLEFCMKHHLLPYIQDLGRGEIAITTAIVTALRRHNRSTGSSNVLEGLNHLKDIAIILGFDYKPQRFGGRVIRVAAGKLQDLADFMDFRYGNE